nr:hypothetical protein [Tanacetum cinerariifolium]
GNERDGRARSSGPRRAADAVHVVFGGAGHVEVHHVAKRVDINAPAHHVGSHQNRKLLVFKGAHGFFALLLGAVAADALGRVAKLVERAHDASHGRFLAGKEHHALHVLGLNEVLQYRQFLVVESHVELLVDARGGLAHGEAHFVGLVQNLLRKVTDFAGHGGREQQRLPLFGQLAHDVQNIVREAHVHHLVGLVEHQVLQVLKLDVAELHVGDEAAGRGNNNVGPAGEGALLLLPVFAFAPAVNGNGRGFYKVAKARYLLVYLGGQLAGGHQHERAGGAVLGVRNLVEQRHQVGGRFAGAGLGAGNEVFARQDFGNRLLLNGRGVE